MVNNIALFLNSLGSGGAERVVSRLSYELVKEYNLYIFLIENEKQFYDCAGQIVVLGKNSKNYRVNALSAVLNINKQIENYNIDCVISFLDVPNIINSMFNTKSKKIISIRDYNEVLEKMDFVEKIKIMICKSCFNRANAMISVSKELNEKAIGWYKFDRKKAYTIENPYDIDEITEYANYEIETDILDFIQSHKTAVAVGRLNEQKGYEDLLEIFDEVLKKCHNAGLIILGEGKLKEILESKIREKGLEEHIKLLGAKKNPFSYMSKCDVYVSASKHEGFPNTLVEAMACGLPVIHTDCMTGPREIMSDNNIDIISDKQFLEYGVLVPSYTRGRITRTQMIDLYCEVWVDILNRDALRQEYAGKSVKRAKFYNMIRCVEGYSNVINGN